MKNSCLYKCTVMHNRLKPKQNRFHYSIFMFYIDLDEINEITKKILLISRNRFNYFNFRDADHLQFPAKRPDTSKNTKEQISGYLKEQGIDIKDGKIMLLTNLCTLGYQFNPVSLYYCFNNENQPICTIVETCNTFREMKPYFIGPENYMRNIFHLNTTKYFYVSPFIDHDTQFDFNLGVPSEKLNIRIDDHKDGERFFVSTLTGKRKSLTNYNVFRFAFRFPLITLKVITLIHWQAVILLLKKLPYHKKSEHKELQQDVYRPHHQ
ncbi:MAG TPA: DUF1365 domain-containing protein [Bacteroidia bacterium]|nr:DUF1365 domain-containing protein [Bacteroidia bacterium]